MTAPANTTYEPFARQPEYVALNRCFVRRAVAHFDRLAFLVDLACGVGTMTELLAGELVRLGREGQDEPRILAVDVSTDSLRLAREAFDAAGLRTLVVQGSGEALPAPNGLADAVLLGNAIHLFTDKPRLVREVSRVLRAGGVFAFNTAFYEGGRPDETERFYDEWLKLALRHVKKKEHERGEARDRTPDRKTSTRAFSNPWLSPQEYRCLIEEGGLRIVSLTERRVETSRSFLEAIGSYAEFASAYLRRHPVELASEALASTVAPALDALGLVTVPRGWLEVIAVKA
ncbi:MAG TPA: class I SAM-dependent methyltransferase [Vicinamibacteria bacterium]|jgi:ubiquinone/menaquinone biosynthesis C-methylase UbiE